MANTQPDCIRCLKHPFNYISDLSPMKLKKKEAQHCCKSTSKNLREFMKENDISIRDMAVRTGLAPNTIRKFRKDCSKTHGMTFWKIGAGIEEHSGTLFIIPLGGMLQFQAAHEDPCPLGLYYDDRCPHNN